MKIKIAENVKQFRKEHSLTQEQLAEALGVTVGAVYKWEAGLSFPEIRLLMELADLFEVSVDVLLGYDQQNASVEAIASRIEQYRNEMKFQEALTECEKALKKYPNNFKVVFQSAITYQVVFIESRTEEALDKSVQLFRQAIGLLYQNQDDEISEVTILNSIAQNYMMAGKMEAALDILKKNNVCGINNALIGLTYTASGQPKEAMSYLVHGFEDCITNLIRTISGYANVYEKMEDYENYLEAYLWLCDLLESIKIDKAGITYADKLKSVFLTKCAIAQAILGNTKQSGDYLREAYTLAGQFDAVPVYNVSGIRFCQWEDETALIYDDAGQNALTVVESMIYDEEEEQEAYIFLRDILEELKHENKNK